MEAVDVRAFRVVGPLVAATLVVAGCGDFQRERRVGVLHSEEAIAVALDVDRAALKGLGVQVDAGTPVPCMDGCPSAWVSLPIHNGDHPDREPGAVVRRLLTHGYTDVTPNRVVPGVGASVSASPAPLPSPVVSPTGTGSPTTCLDTIAAGAAGWSCDLSGPHARVGLSTGSDNPMFEIRAEGETR